VVGGGLLETFRDLIEVQGADIFDTAWSIPKKATRICVAFCSATCGSRSN
jgi:hypothetical protein